MGLVRDAAQAIDGTGLQLVENVFNTVVPLLTGVTTALGILGLAFIAYQQMFEGKFQFKNYLIWFLRYGIVVFALMTWGNFKLIYDALKNLEASYSVAVIAAANNGINGGTENAMDAYIKQIMDTADSLFKTKFRLRSMGKAFKAYLLGVVVLIVGGFYAAVCIVITVIAKVGFIAAMALSPLALTMLLIPQTAQYFRSWVSFSIGFVIIPILSATLMAIAIMTANVINSGSTNFNDIIQFLLLIMGVTFMTMMLPTMASSLAATSVAAVGGAAAAGLVMSGINAPRAAARGATQVKQSVSDASAKASAAYADNQAKPGSTKAGSYAAGGAAFLSSVGSSILQSSESRQRRMENSFMEARGGGAAAMTYSNTGGGASQGGARGGGGATGHQQTPEQMNDRRRT